MQQYDQEARDAYRGLSDMLKEFEANLATGELVGVASHGPHAREFFVQTVRKVGCLIQLLGENIEGNFEQLIFAPSQISLRVFSFKLELAEKPQIGFDEG